jgi:hypothetical protein
VAHILPGPPQHYCEACAQPLPRFTAPAADAPPGWTCPSCRRCYAPWVPECRHCPQPATGTEPCP